MKHSLLLISLMFISEASGQVNLKGDLKFGDIIAARVEDKLYARDTFKNAELEIPNGLYTVVRDTISLFDFIVYNEPVQIIFENNNARYLDSINFDFYRFIDRHLKIGMDLDSNWQEQYSIIIPVLKVVFPTIFQFTSRTHAEISKEYWNLQSGQFEFLKNSPFVRQYISYFYDKMISQNYDSIYCAMEVQMRYIIDNDLRQFYFSVLTNKYETSKVVGHENVFASIVLGFNKQDFSWVDDSTYIKLISKAEKIRMNPIGATAKNFPIKALSTGKSTSLADVFGIYKLVVFFDSDCGHCKEAMPYYMAAIKDFESYGLTPVLITVETTNEFLEEFIQSRAYDNNYFYYSHPITNNDFRYLYDIPSTPQVYILNSSNKILAKNIPAKELGDYLNFLIKNGMSN